MASPPSLSLRTGRSASLNGPPDHLSRTPTNTTTWTSEQEARLLHCQAELQKAQKRWSASQDLWIEEVDHLLDLKKAHLKAVKKQQQEQAQAKKAFGIWKKRTWKTLSRTSSRVDTTTTTTASTNDDDNNDGDDENDDDDDDENEEEDQGEGDSPHNLERSDSLQDLPPSPSRPSLCTALRRLSIKSIRSSGGGGRRKATVGDGSAVASAEQSGDVTPAVVADGTAV